MTGDFLIDGIDVYDQFGVIVMDNGYNGVIQYPPLKPIDYNNWPEYDGIEPDLLNPKLDTKTFSITFGSDTEAGRENFIAHLSNGSFHDFQFNQIGRTFRLRMLSESAKRSVSGITHFTLSFADDFPLMDYIYHAPVNVYTNPQGYYIDDIDLSTYGIFVADGTNDSIEKMPNVKPNLTVTNSIIDGVVYDGENVVFQAKDVVLKLNLRATIADFWINYYAFLYELTKPGVRYFKYPKSTKVFPCYYKSSTVRNFSMINYEIWCDFDLTISFINIGEGTYQVRFISPESIGSGSRIIKSRFVPRGSNISYPTPFDLTSEGLKFVGWNYSPQYLQNIQNDLDIGAMYETISGETIFYYTLTSNLLEPNINMDLGNGNTIRITWGDGYYEDVTSGNIFSHIHASAGNYIGRISRISGNNPYIIGYSNNTISFFGGNNQNYRNCLNKLYIGENAKVTDLYACINSRNMITAILPQGSITTQGGVFYGASSLRSLIIPTGCTTIDFGFVNGGLVLECISLPPTIITIPGGFVDCRILTNLIIPQNVNRIGSDTFQNMISMEEFTFLSVTPPTLGSSAAFNGIPSTCKIYVPDISLNNYKTATNWSVWANQIYPISDI